METRIAVIGIIVEDSEHVAELNEIMHNYAAYIVGRMGIPLRDKHINVISIVVNAPQDIISALSGKIGRLRGISTKTVYSNIIFKEDEDK